MKSHIRAFLSILPLIGALALSPASAQVMKEPTDPLDSLAFVREELEPRQWVEAIESVDSQLDLETREGWNEFRRGAGSWKAFVDRRSGKVEVAEGVGIPWIPGRGNGLTEKDIAAHLGGAKKLGLDALESLARGQAQKLARVLGIDPKSLVLNQGRSGSPSDHVWFVDFDVHRDGLPIEGARVVFRVNHGNLIQFGTENLPAPGTVAPRTKLTRNQALAVVADYIGG
ncbi:MAG TPA: hypothetical protein VLE27_10660, partial [Thermoanaerobaculia bacterium]|nr:hypothetical protein [Thermoanaerobaculia bacterium]